MTSGKALVRRWLNRLALRAARLGPRERDMLGLLVEGARVRELRIFLQRHDYLVGMAFGRSEAPRGVLPAFPLPLQFSWDFAVFGCAAAWWDVTFVRLGPPRARLYLKSGVPSYTHHLAASEVERCRSWSGQNARELRAALAQALVPFNPPPSPAALRASGAAEMRDERCTLSVHYCFVTGRRDPAARDGPGSHADDEAPTPPSIVTYDRLVDAARRLDRADPLAREQFEFWKG